MVERRSYGSSTTSRLGWWFKGETYGKGRWTQTQLHMRQDKGNKRRAFIKQKLNAKKKQKKQTKWDNRQSRKTKSAKQSSNKTKQQDKVQIKNQSSTQTWKTQNQNIPNRGQELKQEHGHTKTNQAPYTQRGRIIAAAVVHLFPAAGHSHRAKQRSTNANHSLIHTGSRRCTS